MYSGSGLLNRKKDVAGKLSDANQGAFFFGGEGGWWRTQKRDMGGFHAVFLTVIFLNSLISGAGTVRVGI